MRSRLRCSLSSAACEFSSQSPRHFCSVGAIANELGARAPRHLCSSALAPPIRETPVRRPLPPTTPPLPDAAGASQSAPSAPARRQGKVTEFEHLTRQLEAKDAELVPTEEQHAQKKWLLDTLKPLLEKHTGGRLHTFGSCDNGFWMKGSDVDACLVVRRCTQRPSWLTKLRLIQRLVERDQIGTARLVSAARVPIAKIHDNDGIELCDISVNNVAALENSRFVAALARLDPRICILGRFIKHWASRRRINNRAEGTLSTYTLILQLFFFMQTRDPPLLPLVSNLLVDDLTRSCSMASGDTELGATEERRAVNDWAPGPEMDESSGELRPLLFMTDAASIRKGPFPCVGSTDESLGELLHGFFQFWRRQEFHGEDGNGQTVSVYDGMREPNDLAVLVMRCPLTGKNVNPFTASVWRAIHVEFERAAELLSNGMSLDDLCEMAEESPAGRGHRA